MHGLVFSLGPLAPALSSGTLYTRFAKRIVNSILHYRQAAFATMFIDRLDDECKTASDERKSTLGNAGNSSSTGVG